MKRLLPILALILFTPALSWAACEVQTGTASYANGTNLGGEVCDTTGARKVVIPALAGEDAANDIVKVEERYNTIPTGASTSMFAVDTAIKNSPGYVRSIDCYGNDATAVAGTVTLRDNLAAGGGNTIVTFTFLAADYSKGIHQDLSTPFSVGLYADFTTTDDVSCIVRYR